MIVTLRIHYWFAFGGFVVMLLAALFFEHNARKLGRVGLQHVAQSMRAAGLKDYFGNTGNRMRDRFKRDED